MYMLPTIVNNIPYNIIVNICYIGGCILRQSQSKSNIECYSNYGSFVRCKHGDLDEFAVHGPLAK